MDETIIWLNKVSNCSNAAQLRSIASVQSSAFSSTSNQRKTVSENTSARQHRAMVEAQIFSEIRFVKTQTTTFIL